MNTPNKLTVARMIMVPFFVLFILTGWGGDANRYICLAIFVVASITDWFDGDLARKNNLVTNFGKFMEQVRDFASDRIYDSDFAVELYSEGENLSNQKLLELYQEFLKTGSRNITKLKSNINKKDKAKRQKRKATKRKRRRN